MSRTAAPIGYVLASADPDPQALFFSPFPTYSAAHLAPTQSSSSQSPTTVLPATQSPATQSPASQVVATQGGAAPSAPLQSRVSLPPQLVTASDDMPAAALGYADADDRAEAAMPVPRTELASIVPTPTKRAPPPPHPASAGPASATNAVLNNAQIASIRERLRLTSYQTQLWPPVESALRDITWQGHGDPSHKTAANPHGATIDPNSPPVQRLKSAAFPLIMSLSSDQKEEVRSMVRLMGLENLASQF